MLYIYSICPRRGILIALSEKCICSLVLAWAFRFTRLSGLNSFPLFMTVWKLADLFLISYTFECGCSMLVSLRSHLLDTQIYHLISADVPFEISYSFTLSSVHRTSLQLNRTTWYGTHRTHQFSFEQHQIYESLTKDHPSYMTTPMWFWGWSYSCISGVLD